MIGKSEYLMRGVFMGEGWGYENMPAKTVKMPKGKGLPKRICGIGFSPSPHI